MRNRYVFLFVIFTSLLFISFSIKSEKDVFSMNQINKELIGKWKLSLISYERGNKELKEFSTCHQRDYIEYKDSTRIDHIYENHSPGCIKIVKTLKYSLTTKYNKQEHKSYISIKISKNPYVTEEILVLNDSILKVSCDYGRILKTYKKIK